MNIETKGNQTFSVPNTPEGRHFISLCSKFLNKGKMKKSVMGRAKDRRKAFKKAHNPRALANHSSARQSYVPLNGADWLAVYVRPLTAYDIEHAAELKARKEANQVRRNLAACSPVWNYQTK